jgi:hypothetical protein
MTANGILDHGVELTGCALRAGVRTGSGTEPDTPLPAVWQPAAPPPL